MAKASELNDERGALHVREQYNGSRALEENEVSPDTHGGDDPLKVALWLSTEGLRKMWMSVDRTSSMQRGMTEKEVRDMGKNK